MDHGLVFSTNMVRQPLVQKLGQLLIRSKVGYLVKFSYYLGNFLQQIGMDMLMTFQPWITTSLHQGFLILEMLNRVGTDIEQHGFQNITANSRLQL